MTSDSKEVNLELHCDLAKAANFYGVSIDEIELRDYVTPFSVGKEDSNSAITLQCRGCNEMITAHVIEFPKINNFRSSNFIIQLLIIVTIILLPFVNVNISDYAVFVLLGFGLLIFTYDVYTYLFKPPARLDTHFFWHEIKEIKGKSVDRESQVEEIDLTDDEIWKIHARLNESKMRILMNSDDEALNVDTNEHLPVEGEGPPEITPLGPYPEHPNINTPLDEEDIDSMSMEEVKEILEYDDMGENSDNFSDEFTEEVDLNEIEELLEKEDKTNQTSEEN